MRTLRLLLLVPLVAELILGPGGLVSATFAAHTRRQPTFLNVNKPYPNHVFTAVIWGVDRAAFNPAPEVVYWKKRICVTGLITEYRGRPEVIVTSPAQITVLPLIVPSPEGGAKK
ncbi:MAG TPA: hypothetical protein VMS64_23355 [Candidatus Methylomirabilis sp.]|nr:hypothetical protein [Candidatus Methylomirabilis sp.]